MPPQLKTLIPLFAIFITLFLVARYFLVPESFGEQGHYRFNSIQENMDKPMHYAGRDACAECHEDKAEELASDMHVNLSCESCHGAGLAHCENPETTNITIPTERKSCGYCHTFNLTREGKVAQVDLNEHNINHKCIECHNPHKPWEIEELNNPEGNL